MHKINMLAIDASDAVCSLAIQHYDIHTDSITYNSKVITNKRLQAAYLLPTIEQLLVENNLTLENIDALVFSAGPGKFTGLRISASVMQGLAYSLDKKIIPINSLQLYAQQFANLKLLSVNSYCSDSKELWVCLKSHGETYYQAKFVLDNGLVYPSNCGVVKSQSELSQEYAQSISDCYLIGEGWFDILANSEECKNSDNQNIYTEQLNVKHIFCLASNAYQANQFYTSYECIPIYGVNPYQKNNNVLDLTNK